VGLRADSAYRHAAAVQGVYQRTNIPLAQVPAPYQGQLRATVSATSRDSALVIVANVRKRYEACLAAYAAEAKYEADLHRYNAAKGKAIARPPKFTEIQPTTPWGCPAPGTPRPGHHP